MTVNLNKLEDHMKEVVKKFKELQRSGIDEELMVVWIADKCNLSKKDVRFMLLRQKEFYNKLVSDEVAETL